MVEFAVGITDAGSESRTRANRLRLRSVLHALLIITACTSCGVIKKKEPDAAPSGVEMVGKPMPPEKAKEVLSEAGSNFAYGPGLGDAAVTVGTVVVFPPYALYLLGNAVLSLSGYEPVTVSSMLPEEQGKAWSSTYDSMVSGPGKVVAAMAGHEYRSREVGDAKMKAVMSSINDANTKESHVKSVQ
jgi:hypothetical protein